MINEAKVNDELEIMRKIYTLANEIEAVITKVDITLTARLAPVLRSTSDKEVGEKSNTVSMTSLGGKIQEQIDNVRRIAYNLDSLIDKLEI